MLNSFINVPLLENVNIFFMGFHSLETSNGDLGLSFHYYKQDVGW